MSKEKEKLNENGRQMNWQVGSHIRTWNWETALNEIYDVIHI